MICIYRYAEPWWHAPYIVTAGLWPNGTVLDVAFTLWGARRKARRHNRERRLVETYE